LSKVLSVPAEDLLVQLKGLARRASRRVTNASAGQESGSQESGSQESGSQESGSQESGSQESGSQTSYGSQMVHGVFSASTPPSLDGRMTGARIMGAGQESLRQIVEVLLNAPEHYPVVAGRFDPSAIHDSAIAAVAEQLIAMLNREEDSGREDQTLRLDDLIGHFESPTYGRLIIDLQERGERRGGYEGVIDGALTCLDAHARARETVALAEEIKSGRERASESTGDKRLEGESLVDSGLVDTDLVDTDLVDMDSGDKAADGKNAGASSVPPGEDERLLALAAATVKRTHFSTTRAEKKYLSR
jgi:hypothetical protein